MYYALIGLLAIILHFVINSDAIFRRGTHVESVTKDYRRYLNSVLAFYIIDMLWGILSQSRWSKLLYIDTMAYYIAVTLTVVLWARYVMSYLNFRRSYTRVLILVTASLAISWLTVLIVNLFNPIVFDIDEAGRYSSKGFRFIAMLLQFVVFTYGSIQTFYIAGRSQGRVRMRNITIGLYGMALVATVVLQYIFPLLPLYSMGLMIGTCVLHVFVQEDEKAEIRKAKIRNEIIIQALAQSYEQVNYISMNTGSYIASCTSFDISDELPQLKEIQSRGKVQEALQFAVEHLVSPSYKTEMAHFADLSTINERMTHTHHANHHFKNYNEVWYEWDYIVADRNDDGSIKHLIWAIRKIEDEMQAEMRRQKLLEENIAANNAKTVFLQNMSHEIRTPLNAMFGFSQLLGMPDGSWTEDEKNEYNKHVLNSYYMMDMLIGDIIDIADAEHGNYRIEINDIQVNDICKSALTSVEYRKPADVEMRFESDLEDGYTIKTDGRRVQQVLINYLTNACKHTQQGEIILSCSSKEKPGKLVFAVTDTGEGVPEDKANEIFNRFTKLNQFSQGSGLGLNICQMIARKLDGEVYLDTQYRKGARFVFVISDNAR